MDAVTSFTSRRPAAGALPHFSLPPPTSDIPRTAEGISPSLSSVNTGSSQGSQAPSTMSSYSYGHVHGNWQTPGHTSYNLSSTAQQPPLNVGSFGGPRPPIFNQPHAIPFGSQRDSNSPTSVGEALPPPPQDHLHQPFPTPLAGNNSNSFNQAPQHSLLGSNNPNQSPGQSNNLPNLDAFSNGRHQSNTAYPIATSGSQHSGFPAYAALQSPTQPSSTTGGPIMRGLSAMAPPPGSFRPPFSQGYHLPAVNGAVMSNVHHPGGSMSMVGGMGMQSYHGHPMLYHGQAAPQAAQDRPFKCDVCVQAFSRNHDLKRHKRIHLSVKPFPCPHCSKSFSRKDALKRHKLVKGCEKKDSDKASPDTADIGGDDDDIKRDRD